MESHEVLKAAFDSPAASPKEIASDLGVSLSLVYKWAQPPAGQGSGSRNPLDRIARLVDLTHDTGMVEWLCQRAGGYFVHNPRNCPTSGYDVVPATHKIVEQFAGLLDVVARAAQDNEISREESAEIRMVWDRLKSYCEGFVRCCEESDFEPIQRQLGAPPR